MKIEVTEANIVKNRLVAATVTIIDESMVRVDVKQALGWNDWNDLADAVRRVMLMMEVKND